MKLLLGLIGILVTIAVLSLAIPEIWPIISGSTGNITALTGTDAGTNMLKAFWPIGIMLIGIGVGVGLIMYAVRKLGLSRTG